MGIKHECRGLIAPDDFWYTDDTELALLAGGCGPGGVGDWFVPDTAYGLNIKPACFIHDYLYSLGSTPWDKNEADEVFLDNLRYIVNERGGWLRRVRLCRVYSYYLAVSWFGNSAFRG